MTYRLAFTIRHRRRLTSRRRLSTTLGCGLLAVGVGGHGCALAAPLYDVLIEQGTLYDGTGASPRVGDVGLRGDTIVYVGPHAPGKARERVSARGLAVAPGFINMLAHPEVSLLADPRALSDLRQGVTLEVIGEDSMGPLSEAMRAAAIRRQGDIKYSIDWTTLGEYLARLEHSGIAPNVASYVGAGTVRTYVLGEGSTQPNEAQLAQMRQLVRAAMEEGAVGLTTALIYAPNTFAQTPELEALAAESARCGGIYSVHMRSEGDRLLEAVRETIAIAQASQAPAEIFHLKAAGQRNWGKLDGLIREVEEARRGGTRITADMYVYTAGATGLDAAMPPWVQDGGLEAWIGRLKDPATRARVIAEMRDPKSPWENLYGAAGAEGTLLLAFRNPRLKPLTGKTLAEVARLRQLSPEETAIQLVIEDESRVGVAYFLMSEENVRREVALPWVSFDSDEAAPAPEGVFLQSHNHPRAYGNFARVLAKYVREEHVLSLEAAVHKLAGLPADTLALSDRGHLAVGAKADVVLFDPATVQDHATYADPHQLATGISEVWVNGVRALRAGAATGAPSGRIVRGRAWTGRPGGGCRGSARDWSWAS
ncbi:MAG: D-aminoacylase [Gammaproteobacteria bacterium]|nr:D-aminoacylase [Gammaproteobacteria bacterium]